MAATSATQSIDKKSDARPSWIRKLAPGVLQAIVLHALQMRRYYREVFILCDIQGHSVPETASLLNLSAATVMTRLLQARHEMREVIARLCAPQDPIGDLGTWGRDKVIRSPQEP